MGSCKCGCLFVCAVGDGDGFGAKDLGGHNGCHRSAAGTYDKGVFRLETGFPHSANDSVYICVVSMQEPVFGLYHKIYRAAVPGSIREHVYGPEGVLLVGGGYIYAVVAFEKGCPGLIEGGIYEMVGVSAVIRRGKKAGAHGPGHWMAD